MKDDSPFGSFFGCYCEFDKQTGSIFVLGDKFTEDDGPRRCYTPEELWNALESLAKSLPAFKQRARLPSSDFRWSSGQMSRLISEYRKEHKVKTYTVTGGRDDISTDDLLAYADTIDLKQLFDNPEGE